MNSFSISESSNPDTPKYRFRSPGVLSQKELLYGEMYFSSLQELNDPYDTKPYFRFQPHRGRYLRLLESVFGDLTDRLSEIDFTDAVNYLLDRELSYEQLILKVKSREFADRLDSALSIKELPESIALREIIVRDLAHEIHKRVGRFAYVVSFTQTISNPMMWSLYAAEHRGFAMEITPVGGKVFQNPLYRQVKTTSFDGAKVFRPGKSYEFQEVRYKRSIPPIDGFLNFSPHVYGRNVLKKRVDSFWKKYKTASLTKFSKWRSEEEYRLVDLSHWMPEYVEEFGPVPRPSVSRTFHFDQTQLTGVVFGMNMTIAEEKQIQVTVRHMRDRLRYDSAHCLPVFMFYKAVQSHDRYEMAIEPVVGLDYENNQFQPDRYEQKKAELKRMVEIIKRNNGLDSLSHAVFRMH